MPNRGIKVFKIPGDYASFDDLISSNTYQFRDIAIIRPSDYNSKMAIYQFVYDTSESLYPKIIKDYQWEDLTTDINITFTDNDIIPNVTPIRKAHQEDYRSILTFLKNVSVNKYGDFIEGNFDVTNAKLQWNNNKNAAELFLDSSTNNFRLNISKETILNISKVDLDYNYISDLLALQATGLKVSVDTSINAGLKVTGDTALESNVVLNGNSGTTTINGETTINNNLIVTNKGKINSDLEVDGAVTVEANCTINQGLNVGGDTKIHGGLNVDGTVESPKLVANTIDVKKSENSNIVEGFNADMLDGKHLNEIEDEIPKFKYEAGQDFAIKQYSTAKQGGAKTYGQSIVLGKRLYVDVYTGATTKSVYILPGADEYLISNIEYCSCTCTCECTCTCPSPCECCNGSGPI
jgi:cytoskeletal protein CcmA (bactofilin family)